MGLYGAGCGAGEEDSMKTRIKQDWAFDLAKELLPNEWDFARIGENPASAYHAHVRVKEARRTLNKTAVIIRRHFRAELKRMMGSGKCNGTVQPPRSYPTRAQIDPECAPRE